MYGDFQQHLQQELKDIKEAGLYKDERIIASQQDAVVKLKDGSEVLNFCSNNYLGLANDDRVIKAAKEAMEKRGYGLSSVRFICGTQDIHKQLEQKLADFLGTDDSILYAACFDANGGIFEPFFGKEDAIISDKLNHASIIDGIRLCKTQRYLFDHSDMEDLEKQLKDAQSERYRLIVTDGIFSMDGDMAKLDEICDLADQYDALVMVDDSHATGYVGNKGRGTHEYYDVMDRVDVITSTLGKALGGAMGGFTAGRQEIIDMLRQRSRPYLFSNSLAPPIVGAASKVIDILDETDKLRNKLKDHTDYFRNELEKAGFELVPGNTPIIPIMTYDAPKSQKLAEKLLDKGIYVIGFFYPVVPKGEARVRVQLSAAHEKHHLDKAIEAFTDIGKELDIID